MAKSPTPKTSRSSAKSDDGLLPFPVRQRLWDQLWQRLLAPPPAEEGDHTPPRTCPLPETGKS
jgi:hypothetical protein